MSSFLGRYRHKKTSTKILGNMRSGRDSNLALHEYTYQASKLQDCSIDGAGGGGDEGDDDDVLDNNAGAGHDTLDIMA